MDTKARPVYMLLIRAPFQTQEHIQTESEVVEKNIPHKQKSKESWSSKLISEKIDIEINNNTRDKERQ